jgi:multidrug resistance protein, MATE family
MSVTALVAIVNAILNQVLIFDLAMGVAGSAWATTAAQGVGVLAATGMLLQRRLRVRFHSHLVWRPVWSRLRRHFTIGLPMGLSGTADLIAMALFQLMLVRLGTVDGAATQIAMVLTSLAYLPGLGIALAGTTLVGQAIGAGDRDWADILGNAVIRITVVTMGAIGLVLAALAPWLAPLFVSASDPQAAQVVALTVPLLWIAAGYQLFDGLNLGSGFCLRGAADVKIPALLVMLLAWFFWMPLTHMLTFAKHQGFVDFLPAFGFGAIGGWTALLVYVIALGTMLKLRWRSGAWRRQNLR